MVGEDVRASFGEPDNPGSSVYVYGQGRDGFGCLRFDSPDSTPEPQGHQVMAMPDSGRELTFATVGEMIVLSIDLKEQHDTEVSAAGRHPCIGGELWLTKIVDGPKITTDRVHVFDDRERLWNAIQERARQRSGTRPASSLIAVS